MPSAIALLLLLCLVQLPVTTCMLCKYHRMGLLATHHELTHHTCSGYTFRSVRLICCLAVNLICCYLSRSFSVYHDTLLPRMFSFLFSYVPKHSVTHVLHHCHSSWEGLSALQSPPLLLHGLFLLASASPTPLSLLHSLSLLACASQTPPLLLRALFSLAAASQWSTLAGVWSLPSYLCLTDTALAAALSLLHCLCLTVTTVWSLLSCLPSRTSPTPV